MELKDYLHYYIGCKAITTDDNEQAELVGVSDDNAHIVHDGTGSYGTCDITGVKPLLRRLEDMAEGEMVGLLQSMVPADMEDKPKNEDYGLEMFYNDDGLMVDGDIAVGANFTCGCFDGQIGIKKCGSIILFDEEEDVTRDMLINTPMAFHYLLRHGFDLFGLIPAGLAIDQKTVKP